MTTETLPEKPPYRVPTMHDLADIPWNGLVVASCFAGGGGSSLGYRMAGYRVAWANEFTDAAAACYAANADPATVVDRRDIREVRGADVLDAVEALTGSRELHLFDGSPPCTSFSTAGIREDGWGREMTHADGSSGRSDDLFGEYARLVGEIRPRCFVAENVSGLVKGVARGYFAEIHAALAAQGYRVEARMLDAQWLGVPQARQRVIFVGVRDDLPAGVVPAFPDPLPYRYTIRDALPNLVVAIGTSKGEVPADAPAPTVLTHGRLHTHSELSAVVHRPPSDPDVLYLERGPNDERPREMSYDEPAPTVAAAGLGNVREYQASLPGDAPVLDPETGERIDMADRAVGEEWDRLGRSGRTQSERFFMLQRPDPDAPAPTVTATGGDHRGVAGVTHPTQRRKLTLAELRRICAWPDDTQLPGTYQEGWARLGNSVPPVMMSHIAAAVRDQILLPSLAPSSS